MTPTTDPPSFTQYYTQTHSKAIHNVSNPCQRISLSSLGLQSDKIIFQIFQQKHTRNVYMTLHIRTSE